MQPFAIEGELTIYTAAEQKSALLAELNRHDEIALNLANVTEFDTAGLQLLIMLKQAAEHSGKTIRLTSCSQCVTEILQLTRLVSFFGDSLVLGLELAL